MRGFFVSAKSRAFVAAGCVMAGLVRTALEELCAALVMRDCNTPEDCAIVV
jgi:hypothetical protein